MDFTKIGTQVPVLVVSASDLENTMRTIIAEVLKEKEESEKDVRLRRDAVCKRLDVNNSTLWRWDKIGYLKAIHQGRKVYYYESDVKRIENGELL